MVWIAPETVLTVLQDLNLRAVLSVGEGGGRCSDAVCVFLPDSSCPSPVTGGVVVVLAAVRSGWIGVAVKLKDGEISC